MADEIAAECELRKQTEIHKLGKTGHVLGSSQSQPVSDIDNIKVKVTRQDASQHQGSMMDEFLAFLRKYFPDFEKDHLKFPRGFEFDRKRIGDVDGPTDTTGIPAGTQKANDRDIEIKGRKGEETMDDALHKAFKERTSMMWNGFDKENLFKIAKDCVKHALNERRKKHGSLLDVPLLPEERDLQTLIGIDVRVLEIEVKDFVNELFSTSQALTAKDLEKALDEKCKNPKKLYPDNPSAEDKRPAFSQLNPDEQKNYKDNLKKHVKMLFEPNKKKGSKGTLTSLQADQFGNSLLRYFLTLLGKQAEFDHLVVDKTSSTFLHVEVKTYPQQGPTSITKEGLKDVLKKAKNQHEQGDALFNNVLCASARLSPTWTKVNMLCFPNIPNREVFKTELDEPIDDMFLKYILTQAELEKDNWLADLQLGSKDASKEQYERLLAIMIGSAHVSYNSQILDYQKETREVYARVSGGEAVGIGNLPDPLPEHQFNHKDLQKKHLGHVWNIIFWSDEQMGLLNDLKRAKSLVLCGDYGGGKTSVLVSAARKAALDKFKVIVVTTAFFEETINNGYIIDVAIRAKFKEIIDREHVDIEVTSLMDIRKALGPGFESTPTKELIKSFMEMKGDKENLKIFFDEFPVSKGDYVSVKNDSESDLVKMLKAIEENSYQAYVSLKTTCLLDTVVHKGIKTGRILKDTTNITQTMLQDHIERKTSFKVKVFTLRMRNTSKIGKAVLADMDEYAVRKRNKGNFPAARILDPGNSNITVPGERPWCVLGEIGFDEPKMEIISICLKHSLVKVLHIDEVAPGNRPPHIAVICGDRIPPRKVWETIDYLNFKPCLYDGGVEKYKEGSVCLYPNPENPAEADHPLEEQQANLVQWLEGPGGILVTHNRLFAGMEAPIVIFITRTLGSEETAIRSGFLRAVAKLVVISSAQNARIKKVKQTFDVIELTDPDVPE